MMKLRLALLFAALLLIAAACGTTPAQPAATPTEAAVATEVAATEPAEQPEGELFPLVVTFGGLCICHAPVPVGIEKGIFEKHGLDVQLRNVDSGFQAHSVVVSGDAHVADSIVAVAAAAADQGAEATAVVMGNGDPTGQVATDRFFGLVAREGSGIESLEDLAGKKVGLPRGTVAHMYLYYALQDQGLDPDTHAEIVNVSPPDLPSALQSGSVDAIVSWEPLALRALSSIEDSVEVKRGGNHIQFLFQRWVAPNFISERPDIVSRFVTAFAEAAHYTRTHPDETVSILAGQLEGLDEETIRTAYGFLTFDMRVSEATLNAVEQELEFARAVGTIEGEYDFLAHFEPRFLQQVQEEHPEFFEDLPPIPEDLWLELGG